MVHVCHIVIVLEIKTELGISVNFQLKWEKLMSVKVISFLPGLYSLHRVWGLFCFVRVGCREKEKIRDNSY